MRAIFFIACLLFLVFYLYGIAAIVLFSENDPWHFGKLHVAMLSLFRIATYEDWTDIMYINIFGCDMWNYNSDDSLPSRDMCVAPGGKGALAAFYFVLFAIFVTRVVACIYH